ncbi:hypothetical protein C8Q77DRAFT_1217104 [Trametes polyzona]|nr:hypothetical protein C8Q77DRAFT_1217104 [Trametes polyzona]
MSHPVITLYDINSTIPQPWAPNIWRIRLILNYKRLPHRTVWIDLNNIESTLRAIGASHSAQKSDGRLVYTLPVIVDTLRPKGSPVILSNANAIAEYLETTYPARPIFPEGSRAMQALFVHYVQEIFAKPLLPILVPLTHERLPAHAQAHFRRGGLATAPAGVLGGTQYDQAWSAVKDQFNFLAVILDKNCSDRTHTVAMGHDVTYADFALCAVLIWIEKVSPHDCWARIREWNGGRWARLYSQCREYMDVC